MEVRLAAIDCNQNADNGIIICSRRGSRSPKVGES